MNGYVERPGLYIMVFLILLNSCEISDTRRDVREIKQTLAEKNRVQNEDGSCYTGPHGLQSPARESPPKP